MDEKYQFIHVSPSRLNETLTEFCIPQAVGLGSILNSIMEINFDQAVEGRLENLDIEINTAAMD